LGKLESKVPLLNNAVYRLTGIRPTGQMHIGHYFSVIKPATELHATVLIAEYHAPQSDFDDVITMQQTLHRFGVKDMRLQSEEFDAELYFQLLSIARVGELARMTQYMALGGDRPDDNDAHLLVYPVLMVHDVMGYDEILVGDDQTQHINYARDLIERYNRTFPGNSVRLPVARPVGGRVMLLTDPTKKMSKSDPDGCLFLNDSSGVIQDKVRAAVTTPEGLANLVELYRALGGTEEIPRLNSEFKPMLAMQIIRNIVVDVEV
jgi:tryptophanyl-tRNA synthetase